MKLNTLLLTSAATLMVTSVAFAADLPSKKAAPAVSSVQVCKVSGKTGFQLPGSDTCVVLSGYVWAEAKAGEDLVGSYDNYDAKVREQLNVDTYTNTDMGVLHGNVAIRGNYTSEDGAGFAIPNAYMQLGGFTVGLLDSTFGMMDGSPSVEAYNHTPSTTPIQIGYSASLGNGVKVGVALEEVRPSNYSSATDVNGDLLMPDVVGTIDFNLSNASVHLAAAYHDNNYGSGESYDAGYAFDAGVTFNLDTLAKGDTVAVEYAWMDGAAGRIAPMYSTWLSDTYEGTLNSGYSVGVSFHHVLSSNLSANVFGGFNDIYYDDTTHYKNTLLGVNLDYQPVKSFHVKPEFYTVSEEGASGSTHGYVLRIQRDF